MKVKLNYAWMGPVPIYLIGYTPDQLEPLEVVPRAWYWQAPFWCVSVIYKLIEKCGGHGLFIIGGEVPSVEAEVI